MARVPLDYGAAPTNPANSAPINNQLLGINAGGLLAPGAGVLAPAPAQAPSTQQAPAPQAILGGNVTSAPVGATAAASTPATAPPSLNDYIKNNFLYQSQDAANQRSMDNYNAQTLKGTQDVQAQQALKDQNLQQSLADQGNQNANSLAAHGLLRSGFNFQNQDKINAGGMQQQNGINQLLTDYTGQRQTGALSQQDANAAAMNKQIQALTQAYNTQNAGQITGA